MAEIVERKVDYMKICKCGFETKREDFKLCPMCGNELEVDRSKRKYPIYFSAEDFDTAWVEMTRDEADLVYRVLEEANSQVCGYVGSVSVGIGDEE